MKTKIKIKSIFGDVLFEHECESLKEAVEESLKNGTNLLNVNLRGADLWNADLRGANLSHADLRDANLSHADLWGTNLLNVNLRGTDLWNADLRGAKNIPEYAEAVTNILPDGDIIGWKKCQHNLLVKLRIPEDARRSNATGRKCRAEKAEVLDIIDVNNKKKRPKKAVSQKGEFEYKKGETVVCDAWDEDRWNECSGGIHFFITKYEAEQW